VKVNIIKKCYDKYVKCLYIAKDLTTQVNVFLNRSGYNDIAVGKKPYHTMTYLLLLGFIEVLSVWR